MGVNINLKDFYNRHNKAKKYRKLLYRGKLGLQAPEMNEHQEITNEAIKAIGDALFKDGYVVDGLSIGITADTGALSLASGRVYIKGFVHEIEASTRLTAPQSGHAKVGIWVVQSVITEVEDATLRDPVVGSDNYEKKGAARLKEDAFWGLDTEKYQAGDFYQIHSVTDRILDVDTSAGNTGNSGSALTEIAARYDRDIHGESYIIKGFNVQVISAEDNKQVYSVSEGKAHVQGYEVTLPTSTRITVDEDAVALDVEDEPHIYAESDGKMVVPLKHTPAVSIGNIGITIQNTVTLTHGSYSGCADPLPHNSVTAIISVRQGGTTYVQGTDYILNADRVDWGPSGAEPAPGGTFEIIYQYRGLAVPISWNSTSVAISGAVVGSLVLVDYSFRLPRKDVFTLDVDGNITHVRGVSHQTNPSVPDTPTGTLRLCSIDQNWDGLPVVHNNAVQTVPMSTLAKMQAAIYNLHSNMAVERLRTDAMISEPSSKYGIFADAFFDNDMRDKGITQTAAIASNTLMLPIAASAHQTGVSGKSLLDYNHEVVISQTKRTGGMKINPYQAFTPIPPRMWIEPSVDRWEERETVNAGEITSQFVASVKELGLLTRVLNTTVSTEIIGNTTTNAKTIRQRNINVHASGLANFEPYTVRFDSIPVCSGNADATGNVSTIFTIPTGVPTGTKSVQLVPQYMPASSVAYTATGTITTETRRTVISQIVEKYDPLAQTFTMSEARHISGVDLWWTVKGKSEVRVQIRECAIGTPTSTILAEGRIQPAQIQAGASSRITWDPVLLSANVEYALVVLTDTDDHQVAVAELGQIDAGGSGIVTSQPYQVGVLLSSSNASSWTGHQSMDLWFRLLGASFTSQSKTVTLLEDLTLTGVTDLLAMAEVEYPAPEAEVTFVLKQGTVEVARMQANQPLALTAPLSGSYSLAVLLKGTSKLSPVLYGGMQLLSGTQAATGDYVSRAFACGASKKISVWLDCVTPGSSTVRCYIQTGLTTWVEGTVKTTTELGDGWRGRNYLVDCSYGATRIKLVLNGSAAERPLVQRLRGVVIDA